MYDVRPQTLSVIRILSIVILWNVLREHYEASLSLFLLVLALAIVLSSCRFRFIINDDHLIYHVFILFKVSIFKRELHPNQIKQLKFFEVGWFKKAAVIKLIKGMNIRLAILEPTEGYNHLFEFAKKHNIPIYKTKDYLWLEQRNK